MHTFSVTIEVNSVHEGADEKPTVVFAIKADMLLLTAAFNYTLRHVLPHR